MRLPDIARVRLDDVDDEERDPVTVLVVEFVEGRNLPPEGRSGIAAEDEHDWLFGSERSQLDIGGFIELEQVEVRRPVTRLQVSGAGVRPHGLEWGYEEYGIGEMLHHAAEGLRRLMHGPPDSADK